VPPDRDLASWGGLNEPVSALSHLLAAAAVLVLGALLLQRARRDPLLLRTAAAYAGALLLMFGASGVYHALPDGDPARDLFWRVDHAAIWVGLAATFTAVRVTHTAGGWGCDLIRAQWALAAAGVLLELTALDALPLWLSPLLYVGMGWLGLPTVLLAARHHGLGVAGPMLVGGVAVTAGALMDALEGPSPLPGVVEYHEVLHVLTIAGGLPFWLTIHAGADGSRRPARATPPTTTGHVLQRLAARLAGPVAAGGGLARAARAAPAERVSEARRARSAGSGPVSERSERSDPCNERERLEGPP